MVRRSVTATMLVLGAIGIVEAQCAFDAPAKAKSIKSSFVRTYASCPSGTFPAPNSSTMAGVAACASPNPNSDYLFDPEGSCSLVIKHQTFEECPDELGGPCTNIRTLAKCRGLLEPDGLTLSESPAWELGLVVRLTYEDDPNGDMTVVDLPFRVPFPQPTSPGALNGRFNLGTCMDVFPCFNHLTACTQIELLSATIYDADGNAFAKLGSSAR
jgi:hypothetical protein